MIYFLLCRLLIPLVPKIDLCYTQNLFVFFEIFFGTLLKFAIYLLCWTLWIRLLYIHHNSDSGLVSYIYLLIVQGNRFRENTRVTCLRCDDVVCKYNSCLNKECLHSGPSSQASSVSTNYSTYFTHTCYKLVWK